MSLRPLRAAVAAWTPGLAIAADPLHAILGAWPGIVGDRVAAHCWPIELAGPALVIATGSSAWSQQLQLLSETILSGVRAQPGSSHVRRLAFRVGAVRKATERSRYAPPQQSTGVRTSASDGGGEAAPAADAAEALARLRRRVETLRGAAAATCSQCGAVRSFFDCDPGVSTAGSCAPCAGFGAAQRALETERLLYLCPWLEPDAVREQIPGLAPGEVERIRRRLLQRWWLVLERTRRAKRLSRSELERSIASSYVLLQSRLPPDRITSAVVRNLLGPELERLLWPDAPA